MLEWNQKEFCWKEKIVIRVESGEKVSRGRARIAAEREREGKERKGERRGWGGGRRRYVA